MANALNWACAEAIQGLLSELVNAIKADIEDLYDEAFSKHLIEKRSSAAVDPGDKARHFLLTIIARVKIDRTRAPYDNFITILRKKGNLAYLADRIEGERERLSKGKENVDLGPSHEQPKLVPQESDSGRPPSQSVSQQNGYEEHFEDAPTPHPPAAAYGDSSPNSHVGASHNILSFPPSTQDPEEPDNLQMSSPSSLQESQLQSSPSVMIAAGEAVAKLEEEQRKVLALNERIERLNAEVLEQADTKRRFEKELKEVKEQLSDKEGKLLKKTSEVKNLKDNIEKLAEDAKEKDKQLNKYKHEMKEREKEKGEYERKLNELQEENEELKEKHKRAESEIEELRARVAKVEEEQSKMKAQYQALQAQLEEQTKRFREECKMKELEHNNEMLKIEADVERMTRELQQERLKRTEKEREQLGNENKELRRESEIQKAEIDRLNSKLSQTKFS